MDGSKRVVIAGGGAAGALVATRLLEEAGPGLEIDVIEPREHLALGVAYGTTDRWHRLNIPAIVMSAMPDDPDHFRVWAGLPGPAFARRLDYGRYLQEVLAGAAAASQATLRHVRATVERLRLAGDGRVAVELSTGEPLAADAVVLATGVETPVRLPYLTGLAGDGRVVEDPWAAGALDRVRDGDSIAILGTSLTAIDLAGTILNRYPAATVVALSRHGNLPRPHDDPWRPRLPEPAFTVEEFLAFESPFEEAAARLRAYGDDWPRAVDSLRPISQALWMAMDDDLRRTFLAHYRNAWEIRRHRVAAEIDRDIRRWIDAGRLSVHGATIETVEALDGGLRIHARSADGEPAAWDADHLIVAIGPNMDAAANPMLAAAIADGILRPGPLGIAIDVDPATGLVLDAAGAAPLPIYAMGALRKGVLWETLAVPEIRDQATQVARGLLAAE